jgi:hypothetical protein
LTHKSEGSIIGATKGKGSGKMERASEDFQGIDFGDKRITKRLIKVIEDRSKAMKESALQSGEGRSESKAFYRLLSNESFTFEKLMTAEQEATLKRIEAGGFETILVVQDTTDINLNGHKKTAGLGYCSEHIHGAKGHTALALTPDGLPLGILYQKYTTREEAKSPLSESEKRARPIEEKESYRWIETSQAVKGIVPEEIEIVMVCDREGDFYELHAENTKLGMSFVIRVMSDRVDREGEKIISKVRKAAAIGSFEINVPRDTRENKKARRAKMEVSYAEVTIPKSQRANTPGIAEEVKMTIVRINEVSKKGSNDGSNEGIEWILATNIPVNNAKDCERVVEYYVQRWKIERFHYVLKSGCQAEKVQQRSYGKIVNVIFMLSVIAVFIMRMVLMGRLCPELTCDVFFDEMEWKMLYRFTNKTKIPPSEPYSLTKMIEYIGILGGYKHAPSDGEYGLKAIWNGLVRFFDALDIFVGQV